VNGVRQPKFQRPTPHFDQPDAETSRQAADLKRLAARFSRPSYTRDSCIGIAQALAMLAHL
jgi:hypothetical protein